MNVQLGITPRELSVTELIQIYLQQVAAQATQAIQSDTAAAMSQIQHGQAPSLLDLYG